MFGSQALETAIGLALLFFVLASAASAIVEAASRILQKRARDLEATLHDMLTGRGEVAARGRFALHIHRRRAGRTTLHIHRRHAGRPTLHIHRRPAGRPLHIHRRPPATPPSTSTGATPAAPPSTSTGATPAAPPDVLDVFRGTSVYASVVGAAAQVGWLSRWLSGRLPDRFATRLSDRRERPTYMSARAFADTVMELMADDKLRNVPGWEGLRARLRTLDAEAGQVLHIKAGLESWFDETMARLSNAYKRWTTSVLFVVGLIIAAIGNISTVQMAQTLWEQPVVRQAALDAAQQAAAKGASPSGLVTGNVQSIQELSALGLPLGWSTPSHWGQLSWAAPHVLGWVVTALLLMLGAPFWFDALSRLVSLRTTGVKPLPATQDDASATSLRSSIAESGTRPDLSAPAASPGAAPVAARGRGCARGRPCDLARGRRGRPR